MSNLHRGPRAWGVAMVEEERILAERDVSSLFAARGEAMEIENKR